MPVQRRVRKPKRWTTRSLMIQAAEAVAAGATKKVLEYLGSPSPVKPSIREIKPSPSKRPAMKEKIPPRPSVPAMSKLGAIVYGRNLGGRYYKRFRRAKNRKFDKSYNKHGVVFKSEAGSVESCNIRDSVYIGHGVAPNTLWNNVMRALVKKLFSGAGIYIENFSDVVSTFLNRVDTTDDQYRIKYYWRNAVDDAAISEAQYTFVIATAGVPTVTTWNDLVNGLIAHIRTNVPDSINDYYELHFLRFNLSINTGVGTVTTLSTLDAEHLKFDMIVTSHLTLQNRTNDASGSTNILSTTANPVIGKQYDSNKQWLNGFDLSKTQQGTQPAGFDALYTQHNIGIIATNSVDTYQQILRKPPAGWQLGVKKQSNVMMQPGAVRDHRLRWKASMQFNTIVGKLQKYVSVDLVGKPRRCEIGFTTMFGLECMLNDRSEPTELQIGWELNQVYMVKCYVGKPPTVPLIEVQP